MAKTVAVIGAMGTSGGAAMRHLIAADLPLRTTILRCGFFIQKQLRFFSLVMKNGELAFAITASLEKKNGLIADDDIGKAAVAVITTQEAFADAELDLVSDVGSPNVMAKNLGQDLRLQRTGRVPRWGYHARSAAGL